VAGLSGLCHSVAMTTTRQPGKKRYRLDFPELMRLCEQNYRRLTPLLTAMADDDEAVFQLPGARGMETECRVRVLERAPYTTVLRLEQDAPHALLPPARLTVRLYHDANMAEVTEALPFRRVQARYRYPNSRMHQQDEKSQWNRFLAEWLVYIHEQGGSSRGLEDLWAGAARSGGSC
jgi:uncharacterized protein YqiB (DUF1249 family)